MTLSLIPNRPTPLDPALRNRQSSPPLFVDTRLPNVSPARTFVRHAEQRSALLAHENAGFLSFERGFLPRTDPLLQLSPSHRAWDQLAHELPNFYATLSVRKKVMQLPLLDASVNSLPDTEVLRATSLLAILAHAYWYSQPTVPAALPSALSLPWAQLRGRLGRRQEVISYIDLIVYNWRRKDPNKSIELENLRLLFPTIGNEEEQVFYLTQLEILSRCTDVFRALVACQDAVVSDDREELETQFLELATHLNDMVAHSLPKISPHPQSPSYVDAVTWAKTVAPFAVPIHQGDLGPSGTSSPIFNTLDLFFGRKDYVSFLGREIQQLRTTYPPAWRTFLFALARVDVRGYVLNSQNPALNDAFHAASSAYAGNEGFLGRHRMKVYGFLELAFKVGRAVTIGGFGGAFKDRTWDQVDDELSRSRKERPSAPTAVLPQAHVTLLSQDNEEPGGIHRLRLHVCDGKKAHFRAGDHIAIWPTHHPDLVQKTLLALCATGDEPASLTPEWHAAFKQRDIDTTRPTLFDVLQIGALRPVTARVAEALHAQTQSHWLQDMLHKGITERFELWQVLRQMSEEGYPIRNLWENPSKLCTLIPPEQPRVYSISSCPPEDRTLGTRTLDLTIRELAYGESRGTASSFLLRAQRENLRVPFEVRSSSAFTLPDDPKVPVAVIAAGTGISPLNSLLATRLHHGARNNWLILSLARPEEFHFAGEWHTATGTGHLKVDAVFTREGATLKYTEGAGFTFFPGPTARIQDFLEQPEPSAALAALAHNGHIYICGRGGFASTVLRSLEKALIAQAKGSDFERRAQAQSTLFRMFGQRRLAIEAHTDTREPEDDSPCFTASEVAAYNNDDLGYWLTIDGSVYDMTKFRNMHPGGRRIIDAYAGMDATHGFSRAHSNRPDVNAQLAMFRIGRLKTHHFPRTTVTLETPVGPRSISQDTAYHAYIRALQLVVEMQNALRIDLSLTDQPVHPGKSWIELTPYKLARTAETHHRFLVTYVAVLERDTLPSLELVSHALFHRASTPAVETQQRTLETNALSAQRLVEQACDDGARLALSLVDRVLELADLDTTVLTKLKDLLIQAVQYFEEDMIEAQLDAIDPYADASHPFAVLHQQARELLRVYHADVARTAPHSLSPISSYADSHIDVTPVSEVRRRVHTGKYWTLDFCPDSKLAFLHRSPWPVETLSQLRDENNRLLDHLNTDTASYGLIVDTRYAPPRNDESFEAAMSELRTGLVGHFRRTAVLLATPLGELQVSRLGRNEGHDNLLATQSESNALNFARGGR